MHGALVVCAVYIASGGSSLLTVVQSNLAQAAFIGWERDQLLVLSVGLILKNISCFFVILLFQVCCEPHDTY